MGYSNKLLFEEEEGTRGYGIQLSARQRYWVELQFVGAIPLMQMFSELPPDAEGFETAYKLVQAYNTILKHHMMRQCIVLDDPNTFYLTEEKQNDLLSKRGRNIFPEYYNHVSPPQLRARLSHADNTNDFSFLISFFTIADSAVTLCTLHRIVSCSETGKGWRDHFHLQQQDRVYLP